MWIRIKQHSPLDFWNTWYLEGVVVSAVQKPTKTGKRQWYTTARYVLSSSKPDITKEVEIYSGSIKLANPNAAGAPLPSAPPAAPPAVDGPHPQGTAGAN